MPVDTSQAVFSLVFDLPLEENILPLVKSVLIDFFEETDALQQKPAAVAVSVMFTS